MCRHKVFLVFSLKFFRELTENRQRTNGRIISRFLRSPSPCPLPRGEGETLACARQITYHWLNPAQENHILVAVAGPFLQSTRESGPATYSPNTDTVHHG